LGFCPYLYQPKIRKDVKNERTGLFNQSRNKSTKASSRDCHKSYCITATYAGATFEQTIRDKKRTTIAEPFNALPTATSQNAGFFNAETAGVIADVGAALRTRTDEHGSFKRLEVRNDGKLNALTTVQTDSIICSPVRIGTIGKGGQGERIYSVKAKSVSIKSQGGGGGALTGLYKIDLPDGDYTIRKLTPIETERCQTLPDNYTALGIDHNGKTVKISNTQRYRGIGNGFTVDVIAHILSHMGQ
jgi:DNA (cytosine-5)-methyltransferase 3A